ncbi:hypothetical protein GA0115255_115442 [Streptomyces sp. Ncost-T6T-2b]|nr:hypothetical protein GA0115255_115442 [Streptomyces sp. Ncost-T6T-2b]
MPTAATGRPWNRAAPNSAAEVQPTTRAGRSRCTSTSAGTGNGPSRTVSSTPSRSASARTGAGLSQGAYGSGAYTSRV